MVTIEAPILETGYNTEEAEQPRIVIGSQSTPSERHPRNNADETLTLPQVGVFGVFDGTRDHSGETVIKSVKKMFQQKLWLGRQTESKDKTIQTFGDCFETAHQFLRVQNNELSEHQSTATVAKIIKEKNGKVLLIVAHSGDSRAYILRAIGGLECITLDDFPENEELSHKDALDRQRRIANTQDLSSLSETDVEFDKKRFFNSPSLGSKKFSKETVHFIEHEIAYGDRVLIVTDGVSDNVTEAEMESILLKEKNPIRVSQKLIDKAQKRSAVDNENSRGKVDDMSAVVAQVENDAHNKTSVGKKIFKYITRLR